MVYNKILFKPNTVFLWLVLSEHHLNTFKLCMSNGWILVTKQLIVIDNEYFSDFLIVAAKTKILVIVLDYVFHMEKAWLSVIFGWLFLPPFHHFPGE